jgi:hypothetical protein
MTLRSGWTGWDDRVSSALPQEAATSLLERRSMKSNRWFVLLVLALTGCAGSRPPADFLATNNTIWTAWMEEKVDVQLDNVPLSQLPQTPPFYQMNILIGANDAPLLSLRISLKAKGVTHRQALWMIAEKYDLLMNVGYTRGRPSYVEISKRPSESEEDSKR